MCAPSHGICCVHLSKEVQKEFLTTACGVLLLQSTDTAALMAGGWPSTSPGMGIMLWAVWLLELPNHTMCHNRTASHRACWHHPIHHPCMMPHMCTAPPVLWTLFANSPIPAPMVAKCWLSWWL